VKCGIESGNTEAIKLLLSCSKLDICSNYNQNLLILSCKENNVDLFEILMADGRFDPSYDNNTAIKEACRNGNENIVKILLGDSAAGMEPVT
jgi:ankyrin repeat protein